MNLLNNSAYAADYTTCVDAAGRNHLLIVVKATYRLPLGGEPAELIKRQLPPVAADTATGVPGESAPEYECDYVLTKPRCDVLLIGSAYAPQGTPVDKIGVGMRVGTLSKAFLVHGPRVWETGLLGVRPGPAALFTRQRISYDIAFGGGNPPTGKKGELLAFLGNPVGVGYHKKFKRATLAGTPMPQTEAVDAPIVHPSKRYAPKSFGPIGRSWESRARYAGTYDKQWEEKTFPFLPSDFDPRYFQSAPEDQQLDQLVGGETVTLLNLTHPAITPTGRLDFVLPDLSLEIAIETTDGEVELYAARADTLVIEPDRQCFSVTWRLARPLHRYLSEIEEVVVGHQAVDEDAVDHCCSSEPAAA